MDKLFDEAVDVLEDTGLLPIGDTRTYEAARAVIKVVFDALYKQADEYTSNTNVVYTRENGDLAIESLTGWVSDMRDEAMS